MSQLEKRDRSGEPGRNARFCTCGSRGGAETRRALSEPYLTAVDKKATSAWIWDGLSVLLNVSGMIPLV
jgi:hypothetical protein